MNLLGKALLFSALALIFIGSGYFMGIHAAMIQVSTNTTGERFQKVSDTEALDAKTGKLCMVYDQTHEESHGLPRGVIIDGSCQQLAIEK